MYFTAFKPLPGRATPGERQLYPHVHTQTSPPHTPHQRRAYLGEGGDEEGGEAEVLHGLVGVCTCGCACETTSSKVSER